jgi:predicted permease
MLNDLRYTFRILLKNPAVTAAVVMSLAIGIGANLAIFNLINMLLFRPPPIEQPAELVAIYNRHPPDTLYGGTSFPDYVDFQSRNTVFAGIVAYVSILPLGLNTAGQADRVYGQLVSGNYFSVLGVRAVLGRGFLPEEDRVPGASPVAVISYRLWQNQFHADPDIIGKQLKLNGHSFTLVGVAPKEFRGMFPGFFPDVWVPLMMQAQLWPGPTAWLNDRAERPLWLLARLKPGIAIEAARAELTTLAGQIEQAYPQINKRQGVTLLPERETRPWPTMRGNLFRYLGLLLAMVSLVWLIACSNVTNLMLAAGHARQRELGIRQALGAGRGRLIKQMLTESLLLALLGSLLGLLIAAWTTDLLLRFRPINIPGLLMEFDLNPGIWSFGYMLMITLLTGIICGLIPAFRASKLSLAPVLKGHLSSSSPTFPKASLRDLLVTVQVALSVLLLIGAGLLTRTLLNARATDLGFDSKNLLVMEFDLNPNGYDESRGRLFYQQLLERVGSLPGVKSLSLSQWIPLSGFGGWSAVQVEDILLVQMSPWSSIPILLVPDILKQWESRSLKVAISASRIGMALPG